MEQYIKMLLFAINCVRTHNSRASGSLMILKLMATISGIVFTGGIIKTSEHLWERQCPRFKCSPSELHWARFRWFSRWFDSVESVVIQWWWCRMKYKRPIDAFCFFFIQMIYITLNIRCEHTKGFFCFHLPITTSFLPLLIEKASENKHQVHVPIFTQSQLTKKIQSKTRYFTLTKQWWLLNNIIGRDFEIKSQFPSCSGCDPKKDIWYLTTRNYGLFLLFFPLY